MVVLEEKKTSLEKPEIPLPQVKAPAQTQGVQVCKTLIYTFSLPTREILTYSLET
jgi:hypothetical protein